MKLYEMVPLNEVSRRDFLKGALAVGAGAAGMYGAQKYQGGKTLVDTRKNELTFITKVPDGVLYLLGEPEEKEVEDWKTVSPSEQGIPIPPEVLKKYQDAQSSKSYYRPKGLNVGTGNTVTDPEAIFFFNVMTEIPGTWHIAKILHHLNEPNLVKGQPCSETVYTLAITPNGMPKTVYEKEDWTNGPKPISSKTFPDGGYFPEVLINAIGPISKVVNGA